MCKALWVNFVNLRNALECKQINRVSSVLSMAKTKTGKVATGLTLAGFFFVLVAFFTPNWLETDGKLPKPKFEKIGELNHQGVSTGRLLSFLFRLYRLLIFVKLIEITISLKLLYKLIILFIIIYTMVFTLFEAIGG